MSMDIDDDAVSSQHPHHYDSAKMNTSGPSGGRIPLGPHPQKLQIVGSVQASSHSASSHPSPGCERLSGSDGSPQLMIPLSPSAPVNHLGETGDITPSHGLARQRRGIFLDFESSERELTPRKRKNTHDSPHTHIVDHNHSVDNDAFTDSANSQPARRIRPRLWTQQDREFSPLLYISPGQERDPLVEEETISAFHYSPNVADPSSSIQRYFHLGNSREQDPCTLQSGSSPQINDLEDHGKERKRSDSANSFAEVALASAGIRKHGRLSTLQDFWLPRPFEEIERQPSVGIIKVHERGLEAGPLFLSTNGGRTGGLSASREPAPGSPTDTLGHPIHKYGIHACSSPSARLPLEPSSTNFFDKPICDSPDPIDPIDEDGFTHVEVP